MKFRFSLLLFICLLFVNGCSANYNLNIDKDFNIEEELISSSNIESDISDISNFPEIMPIDYFADDKAIFENKLDGAKYYDVLKNKDNSKIKIKYKHSIDTFNNSMIARSCYKYITVMNSKNNFLLSTSKEFLCFDKYDSLDDLTITITSKYKLKDTNADLVEKHKYTWYINRENYKNKYLHLELDTSALELSIFDKFLEGKYANIFTVSLFLSLIAFLGYIVLKKYSIKKDEI